MKAAAICDPLKDLAKDADLLLHWCYRLSIDRTHPALAAFCPTPVGIAKLANEVGAKRLLISHFRIHMDSDEGHASAKSDLEAYNGSSEIIEDLNVYEI